MAGGRIGGIAPLPKLAGGIPGGIPCIIPGGGPIICPGRIWGGAATWPRPTGAISAKNYVEMKLNQFSMGPVGQEKYPRPFVKTYVVAMGRQRHGLVLVNRLERSINSLGFHDQLPDQYLKHNREKTVKNMLLGEELFFAQHRHRHTCSERAEKEITYLVR